MAATASPPPPDWARDPVIDSLAERAAAWLRQHPLVLEDLCLGLKVSWAVVRDAQGRRALGTALTPVGEAGPEDSRVPPWQATLPSRWADWSLPDLALRLRAQHPDERCLALALINAASQARLAVQPPPASPLRGGIVRWVAGQRPQRLVMVGNMQPLAEGFRQAGIAHVIFERSAADRCGALSDAQEWAWLPEADGLVITGAALLNHSLSPMIAMARKARFIALVGFSAQAHPDFLAGSGVTHLFSMRFADVDAMRSHLQVGNWNAMFGMDDGYRFELRAASA